ncbi:MAG: DUF1152 domain-containing protein [Desulfurococcales archaeon]|nr:DUF1152 domain-containing protein [Desulfurococcales archaeon]
MSFIVGGLGGGGDIGLALILATRLQTKPVFASFSGCSPDKYGGSRIVGSLFTPTTYHPRDFEWSLKRLAPKAPVYRVCLRAPWEEVMEGVEWLISTYKPRCMLHADLGGDGLLTGYEESLGSYIADTLARAVLHEVATRHRIRSTLAVGALQLEGGRRRLFSLEEQVAAIAYYDSLGHLLGVIDPPRDTVHLAKLLLYPGKEMISVMLPLYIASLEGRTAIRITKGYSTGYHKLDWWTPYVFLLDTKGTCEASPLCRSALENWINGIANWQRPNPPQEYTRILKRVKRDPEGWLKKVIKKYTSSQNQEGTSLETIINC